MIEAGRRHGHYDSRFCADERVRVFEEVLPLSAPSRLRAADGVARPAASLSRSSSAGRRDRGYGVRAHRLWRWSKGSKFFDRYSAGRCTQEGSIGFSCHERRRQEQHMHATIRRYDGVDQTRTEELTRRVDETLVPKLSKLEGFKGYYLIEAGDGVMSSLGLFESAAQADESTRITASWVRDEKLETALPNPPKITSGKVVAHKNGFVAV
jgi:hypothetical protein